MIKVPSWEPTSFEAADARLNGALSVNFNGDYENVLFFAGDLTLSGDFTTAAEPDGGFPDATLIAVAGDLTVDGPIELHGAPPALYVGGYTRAHVLWGEDTEIVIQDATITHLVFGGHSEGTLCAGTVRVPWVINYFHDLRIDAPDAIRFGDEDQGFDDFTHENAAESFVPEVLNDPYLDPCLVDEREFLARLTAGLPVLLPGARTWEQRRDDYRRDHVAGAVADRVTELDLGGLDVPEFPPDVLRMSWLRTLRLGDNGFTTIPDGIGALTELEHLSLHRGRGVRTLPDTIGDLTRLRVLRISNCTNFAMPAAIGRLANLEVLDISRTSPSAGATALPDSFGALHRLRTLVAVETDIAIPPAMHGLPELADITISQPGDGPRPFPDAVTTFPNLRRLEIRDTLTEIPASLLRLTQLEELQLDGYLDAVTTPLPDLGALPRLRVLRLRGRANAAGRDVLRSLFGMRLAALEELDLSHWGDDDPLTADVLVGIGSFRALRRLDLSGNHMAELPDDFYTLPALREVHLRYNALDHEAQERLAAAFPNTTIDLRDQHPVEPAAPPTVIDLVEAADLLRSRHQWAGALAGYDQVIDRLTGDVPMTANRLLYAHHAKLNIHTALGRCDEGTERDRAAHRAAGIAVAETCIALAPGPDQWYFKDDHEFAREVVRDATDFLARETITAQPAPTRHALARALELIELGIAADTANEHPRLRDTRARVLLALGREADAWRVVRRTALRHPDFAPTAELARDDRYRAWLAHVS